MNTNWYSVKNERDIDSPAMLVYPARVQANINAAIELAGDASRLRPHIKTNKSPDAVRMMMRSGIDRFKCATIAEAELLGMAGARDVLLAYQPVGPKIARFIELIRKYPATGFSCISDNLASASALSGAFAAEGLRVRVFIDLNSGMDRTGVAPDEDAVQLYSYMASAEGITLAGIHAYDGHIRDADFHIRRMQSDAAFETVNDFKSLLLSKGLPVPLIVVGGTPGFPIHARRNGVECSPGTFIYWDKGYMDNCAEQPFIPAVALLTRVISLPSPSHICTDLGHKSVSAENAIDRRVYFPGHEDLIAVAQSEEHLVLQSNAPHSLRPGDVLYGIPYHVCPTVALYERLVTINDGIADGEWKTIARDRKLTI